MKIYYWIGVFIVFIGVFSCTAGEDEVSKLKSEVIAVHDEVMPKMGELRSYQKSLSTKAEELRSTASDTTSMQDLKQAANACEVAYEGMFVWMRQFDPKLEGLEEEESLTYLQDQLVQVTQVNRDIKKALDDAERLLEE